MKILITSQTYFRRDNGQAVFTINLAEGLANAGHEVLVVVPGERGRAERKTEGKLILQLVPALPLGHHANLTAFSDRIIRRTLTEFRPDVVHVQDHYFLSRAVIRVAASLGCKIVGTNHFLPENWTDTLRIPRPLRGIANHLLWQSMLTVYNQLDAVTAPTQTAVSILKAQQLRPPAQAISCGIDQRRFRPRPELDRQEIRRRHGIATDKTILLYVGRVDREKCLDIPVRALDQLARPDLQLVIVGKGRYLPELQRLTKSLSLEDQVLFPGFIPDEDLPLLLNSADLFVMPSHAELQSIATLEAMSSGLPILAARARALPELVQPGENGALFAPYNVDDAAQQLTTLLEQSARWAAMGAVSIRKATVHAHPHTIQRYAEWYAQARPATHPLHYRRPSYQHQHQTAS